MEFGIDTWFTSSQAAEHTVERKTHHKLLWYLPMPVVGFRLSHPADKWPRCLAIPSPSSCSGSCALHHSMPITASAACLSLSPCRFGAGGLDFWGWVGPRCRFRLARTWLVDCRSRMSVPSPLRMRHVSRDALRPIGQHGFDAYAPNANHVRMDDTRPVAVRRSVLLPHMG